VRCLDVNQDLWALSHAREYERTVKLMHHYVVYMPKPVNAPFDVAGQASTDMYLRTVQRDAAAANSTSTIENQKYWATNRDSLARLQEPLVDGWGNEIVLEFDQASRTVSFRSNGPDKITQTPDDVICRAAGHKLYYRYADEWRWDYTPSWTLPEGLQPVINRVTRDPAWRLAQFSRVVK
jgi:hypothetical protein